MSGFLTNLKDQFRIDHWTGLAVMNHSHVHSLYELYLCIDNVKQKSVINGEEYEYHYPCAILSPPYTVHSMSCDDPADTDFERYVFYFGEELLISYREQLIPSDLNRANVGQLFPLTEEQAAYLRSVLKICYEENPHPTTAEQKSILIFLLNKIFDFCPKNRIIEVGLSSEYIGHLLRYIAEHFQETINAESIAKAFSISRSKLDRDFKCFTGITPHQFIEICRINHAKILLQKKDALSIKEIAEACGFESETYFFPFFKKCTGMTPMEFRQNTMTT